MGRLLGTPLYLRRGFRRRTVPVIIRLDDDWFCGRPTPGWSLSGDRFTQPAKKAETKTDRRRRSLCFCAHLVREDLAHRVSFTESLVPATAEGKTLQDVQNPVGSS